ncbi:MAG: hypothetical protein JXB35_17235, partial [Anaerolineae bacterium]|nr:hypothetical protein [Anaerolineae bacterium]
MTGEPVDHGYFTLYLKPVERLDPLFSGGPRWIELKVRPTGAVDWITMPRQPATPVPYAWGLKPGADIDGNQEDASLRVVNFYGGAAYGPALHAINFAAGSATVIGQHEGDGSGLYGMTSGPNHAAIVGEHTGNGAGIEGISNSGAGIFGHTEAPGNIGVLGTQPGYDAGDLDRHNKPGGLFGGRNGVIGISKDEGGYGVFGWSQAESGATSTGVRGETEAPDGWAGYFLTENGNGVYISAPEEKAGLNVAGGTKNAVVATNDGPRLLYSEESSEVWFSHYGFGQLDGGVATIRIEALYAQTVNLDEPYHVFVQVYGDAEVYVSQRTATSFEVHLREGDPAVAFSYRVVAKRLGYEDHYLEPAPWAEGDPNLTRTGAP